MQLKGKILLVLVVLAAVYPGKAQENKMSVFSVTVSPQYWLNDALRVDLDGQLPQGNQYLRVGLLYYTDDANNEVDLFRWHHAYETMTGGGLRVYHKLFLPRENRDGEGFYFAYGAAIDAFAFDIPDAEWKPYKEDGVEYYRYNYFMARQYNIKYGADFIIGTQWYKNEPFLKNLYFGFGIRYSSVFGERENPLQFQSHILDFGYKGALILLGLEIGGVLPN